MKLNFWQWLGVAVLIIGCTIWIYEWSHKPPTPEPKQMPTSQNIRPA
jgi:hypothetical protein